VTAVNFLRRRFAVEAIASTAATSALDTRKRGLDYRIEVIAMDYFSGIAEGVLICSGAIGKSLGIRTLLLEKATGQHALYRTAAAGQTRRACLLARRLI
jgi:hypothetical protein